MISKSGLRFFANLLVMRPEFNTIWRTKVRLSWECPNTDLYLLRRYGQGDAYIWCSGEVDQVLPKTWVNNRDIGKISWQITLVCFELKGLVCVTYRRSIFNFKPGRINEDELLCTQWHESLHLLRPFFEEDDLDAIQGSMREVDGDTVRE